MTNRSVVASLIKKLKYDILCPKQNHLPYSCQCRWYMTRRVGSIPLNVAEEDWEFDESE